MKEKLNIIKVGGKIVENPAALSRLISQFAQLPGLKMLVHGGGRTATDIAAQMGVETKMVEGRRVTDTEMLRVVTMVYGGLVNKNVVAQLNAAGLCPLGLTGADMDVIRSHRRAVTTVDYGFVGDVDRVDGRRLAQLLESGLVPVMAPLTHDGNGQMLNTNADTIAGETAKALAPYFDVTLTYCFEFPGVCRMKEGTQELGDVIPEIDRPAFEALKADGTVVAVGNNNYGRCDVSDWTAIVAVSTGDSHTVGLKADSTVVAVGSNNYGRCNVSDWTNIAAVSAGSSHTVGLKDDGTVLAVGSNTYGQCSVSGWMDIVAVSAGTGYTVGLKADGTVVATGCNDDGRCNVSSWADIVAVSAGASHTVGLKADGTVVAVGDNTYGQCDLRGWTNIIAVSAGVGYTVGLKADGTVVAIGSDSYGKCNVRRWTDIVAVSAGNGHTVGLKADGTVVATGDNADGQCDVLGWTDIKYRKDN